MESTEFYRGQYINIETHQNSDGTWTAVARLPQPDGEAETLSQSSVEQTEDLAKRSALSLAAGELDRRGMHTGKP